MSQRIYRGRKRKKSSEAANQKNKGRKKRYESFTTNGKPFGLPLGFDLGVVSLSYVVEDTAGIRQKSARVWIAEDEAFSRLVYDSGERSDIDPLDFEPEAD